MPSIPPPYFYSQSKIHMSEIAQYSKKWGIEHARTYVTKLYHAIEKQNKNRHDRPFPKTGKAKRLKKEVYYFQYKSKSSDRGGYCVFYRRLSAGNMGVIAIIESSRNLPEHLLDAVDKLTEKMKKS